MEPFSSGGGDHVGVARVKGLSSIVAVSAGGGFNMALRADGSVWTWGSSSLGALGLGDVEATSVPTRIPGLDDIVAICAGANHALALKKDGTVWVWGANYDGEIGNGQYTYPRYWWPEELPAEGQYANGQYVKAPIQMPVTNVKGIAAGNSFSLLLKEDGTVMGCGSNYGGELGHPNALILIKTTPIQIPNLNGLVKIAAGHSHSIALKDDSTVWTWGINQYGQIGDGVPDEGNRPPQVILQNGAKIAAGNGYSMVQKSDGTLWAWGQTTGMELYYSTYRERYEYQGRNTPIQVVGATGAMALASTPHHGQIAYASFPSPGPSADIRRMETDDWLTGLPPPSTPPRMSAGSVSVPLGLYESDKRFRFQIFSGPYLYGLNDVGSAFAWGSTYTATPSHIAPSGIVSLNKGANSYFAPYGNYNVLTIGLQSDGSMVKWRPYLSSMLPAIPYDEIDGISDVVAISGDASSATHALKRDGSVWILAGTGPTPTQVAKLGSSGPVVNTSGLSGVIQISAGPQFCLALKKDGTVWGWGSNGYRVLGNSSVTNVSTPVPIAGLSNVKSVYVSGGMAHVIKGDGTVWAWGTGYPGNGYVMYYNHIPTHIVQLKGMVSIHGSHTGNMGFGAIDGNGRAYSWGPTNSYGVLGVGPVSSAPTPTLVPGLENVVEAYKMNIVGLFRLESGAIYSCGSNEGVGLLATGVLNSPKSYTPVGTLFPIPVP